MKASYGFVLLIASTMSFTLCSCSRPKEIKPIKIILSSDRPIAAAPNLEMPTNVLQLAKLVEIDDIVYQPVLYFHRTDLDEPMIKIEVEKSFLNDFRNSIGIRNSKNIIDDYSKIDQLKTTDYYSKPGKFNKPLSTIPSNNLKFLLKAKCSDINGEVLNINDLINRMIVLLKEKKCLNATDSIFITHIWEPIIHNGPGSENGCSNDLNKLKRYYESNRTITIESKLYDLKQLLKKPDNKSDYCIYLEIATYYNHMGGLNRNRIELDECLNYLDTAKIVAEHYSKIDSFYNDLDNRIKSGFFKNSSWLNNSMISRFNKVRDR